LTGFANSGIIKEIDKEMEMKSLVTPLEKKTDKVPQEDYERIYNLYQEKKSQLTFDGEKRVVISRLSSRFPIVSIAGTGKEVEYSFAAVERILNNSCKFRS
jgi:hypothetical protein